MMRRIDEGRRRFVQAVAALGASRLGAFAALGSAAPQIGCAALGAGSDLPSLAGATAWLNSPALTPEALRGKVVLVQFCTYSCINWLRTLPHVRAWALRYGPQGLVVLGVHTPEFDFEKDTDAVRRALQVLRVEYPVALDPGYAVWNAFQNSYWPALYLVDARGRIRHRHFGEGEYERTEGFIRRLLGEAGTPAGEGEVVDVAGRGAELEADWGNLRTPEAYLGFARARNFASPGGLLPGRARTYEGASRLPNDEWTLAGEWSVGRQSVVLAGMAGRIAIGFHARDVHLVMGVASAGSAPVRFRVRVDGQLAGGARGVDLDERGEGMAAEPRLYQLLRQSGPIRDRTCEVEFLAPGVAAYSFTFG